MVYRFLYCVLTLIPAEQFNALQIINCEQLW